MEGEWWKGGVVYQIYPRSYCDANGDGIGDLPGIRKKLGYLGELGIDAVWLSPINVSPMYDFGYDVADYRAIDPVFGTDADFTALIEEAHALGIKIIMDMVLNHTSFLHPWFVESRSSRGNPKRDWYIWHDGKSGRRPNNWLAAFGGRAWEWDEGTKSYYLHSFAVEQPDVNFRNPALKKAMFGELEFWLDRGVDGFRFDVINWFIKDDQFRNNGWRFGKRPRPYDLQDHLYDRNRPETHGIVREIRSLLDSYGDRMCVGETFSEAPGDPELSASYLGNGSDELHLSFDFSLIFRDWNAKSFAEAIERWLDRVPAGAWPCHVLSNHDQSRIVTRFGGGDKGLRRARAAAVLLLTLRGTPFMYYGDELGMEDGRLSRKDIVDPAGLRYWPFFKGRDPERTPMQWTNVPNGGFSEARPWLPVSTAGERNVELELRDPDSMLSLYKRLIRVRKEHPGLRFGEMRFASRGEKGILSYERFLEGKRFFVAVNFSDSPEGLSLPEGRWLIIASAHRSMEGSVSEGYLQLPSCGALVLSLQDQR
jgi:alpha-glucosidase